MHPAVFKPKRTVEQAQPFKQGVGCGRGANRLAGKQANQAFGDLRLAQRGGQTGNKAQFTNTVEACDNEDKPGAGG